MSRSPSVSVLLVDDSHDLADIYKHRLEEGGGFVVTATSSGKRAKDLASSTLFDVVVIDVKIQYKGFEYGGLRLADDLRPRYGANSVLLISQYVTQSYLQNFDSAYEFLQKVSDSSGAFTVQLADKVRSLRARQYVFVAMPFSGQLDDIYETYVKKGIDRAGFKSVRMDHLLHTRRIHEVMFDLLDKSKAVVFMADGANPNAYYEAGFAEALGKEVVVVAKTDDELRFDVRTKATIFYGTKASIIGREIANKLNSLRLLDAVGV